MKYRQLPQILYENGKAYYLESKELSNDEVFKGWWCCQYIESLKDGASVHFAPAVTDGKGFYYLISCEQSKKAAEKNLLDRINRMTKILTQNDIDKIDKEWDEMFKKARKKLKKIKK